LLHVASCNRDGGGVSGAVGQVGQRNKLIFCTPLALAESAFAPPPPETVLDTYLS
jgi:hypothetical protein